MKSPVKIGSFASPAEECVCSICDRIKRKERERERESLCIISFSLSLYKNRAQFYLHTHTELSAVFFIFRCIRLTRDRSIVDGGRGEELISRSSLSLSLSLSLSFFFLIGASTILDVQTLDL